MKKKQSQKGFAALEGLLILIIIAIIGGTGYYVWHSKNQIDSVYSSTANSSVPKINQPSHAEKKTAPSSNSTGTIVKSADGKVQMRLPAGWKVVSRNDSGKRCFAPTVDADGTCVSDISFGDVGYVKVFNSNLSAESWTVKSGLGCDDPKISTVGANPEYICQYTSGYGYTVSNGSYDVYFALDNSAASLAIVDSVEFL
ncbi:MAG TPA: hypothetical protein VFW90_02330 [Candidatus Saccharimonadales bacterium]|nr:hypothetical protein [Candidatus Saccharimonadales bacterium]